MDLSKLNIFIEVIRHGSFAETGRALDLDASLVSRAISQLETELGVRLFQRTTRNLSPTEEGLKFYSQVEPLVSELFQARINLQDQKNKPSGTLRITSPVSLGLLLINPLLPKFHKMYPEIQIEYLITDSVLNLLEERIDVAIRFGHLNDSSFISQKLFDLKYIVCASPTYLKKHSNILKPSDLEKHNCLQFLIPGFDSGWKFKSKDQQIEPINIRGNYRASNALALKDAAIRGSGLTLLAKILIEDELKSGQLVNVFPKHEVTATDFGAKSWVLYPSKNYVPHKTKLFIDFLKTEIKR